MAWLGALRGVTVCVTCIVCVLVTNNTSTYACFSPPQNIHIWVVISVNSSGFLDAECVCVCVCARARACVRACLCACVCVCAKHVRVKMLGQRLFFFTYSSTVYRDLSEPERSRRCRSISWSHHYVACVKNPDGYTTQYNTSAL